MSILISLIGLLLAELMDLGTYKPPRFSPQEHNEAGPMILFSQAQFSNPLPKHYCVLSGVALLPTFTGWLAKMGRTFRGFMSSMHQIGINTIYLLELKCLTAQYDVKERSKHTISHSSMNIRKFLLLLIFIILYPTKWYASALNQKKTAHDYFHHWDAPSHQDYSHNWEITEDELLAIQHEK